jgi:hypothetical protein
MVALFAGGGYIARHLTSPLPEQAKMTAWAQRWDERDLLIREGIRSGNLTPVLAEVEVVRGLEDIGPNPGNWVNRCARAYYGLKSIQTEP